MTNHQGDLGAWLGARDKIWAKLPGNSKKLDVLRWRPRSDAWKANGPISSLEKMLAFEALLFIESREPRSRRAAKYARPPFELPLRRWGFTTKDSLSPALVSVKSLVDLLQLRRRVTKLSEQVRSRAMCDLWMACEGVGERVGSLTYVSGTTPKGQIVLQSNCYSSIRDDRRNGQGSHLLDSPDWT